MEKQKNVQAAAVSRPFTDNFRDWVQKCLVALGVSALSVGRAVGLGKNTLGDFLRDPGRNIHLESAHGITCHLRILSADLKISLPRLEVSFNAK